MKKIKIKKFYFSIGHFQKVVFTIALMLMIISIVLVSIILFVGLTVKESTKNDPIKLVELCLVIIVASIPIALPAVTTGTMAVGARNLASEGAVTRRLTAIEELAGMEILCVDKTGTLTKNELTIDVFIFYFLLFYYFIFIFIFIIFIFILF